jgi:hypothetical protein
VVEAQQQVGLAFHHPSRAVVVEEMRAQALRHDQEEELVVPR